MNNNGRNVGNNIDPASTSGRRRVGKIENDLLTEDLSASNARNIPVKPQPAELTSEHNEDLSADPGTDYGASQDQDQSQGQDQDQGSGVSRNPSQNPSQSQATGTQKPAQMPVRPQNPQNPQPRQMPVRPRVSNPQSQPQPQPQSQRQSQSQPKPQSQPQSDSEPQAPQTQRLKQKNQRRRISILPTLSAQDERRHSESASASAARSISDLDEPEPKPKKVRSRTSVIVGRTALVLVTVIGVALFAVVGLCRALVLGPSETVRDLLVVSAKQASATKWLPGLFLDDATIDDIMARSEDVQPFVRPMGSLVAQPSDSDGSGSDSEDNPGEPGGDQPTPTDEWADAIDGMILKTYAASNFKAYILLVRDPSRLYVGTSSDYKSGKIGSRIFDIVEREGAVAAINAGEFSDVGGTGTGNNPIGLTYSKGECVWSDSTRRTFIGFDNDGVLHAVESMTREKADELGIRDAVSFQTGNVLIDNDGEFVTSYYSDGNVGRSQRTAIGQRSDGTVILIVTDGRTASSLGATRNDIIDLMLAEGAVVAGMLDGGSSSMMYYEDYYTVYGMDTTDFDQYQLQGLVNKYKAFTKPRHMPTFFMVSRSSG